jgi:ABC-2 type transport system permease protein
VPEAATPLAAEPAVAPRSVSERLQDAGLPAVLALTRRDIAALFLWPPAYAICAVVAVPASLLGYLLPALAGQTVSMEGVFGWAALATALVMPLVTMRLLASERRSGALEQLLATPVRLHEVVVARWLAGFIFFLASIAFTPADVVLLAVYQPGFDAGAVVSGYLGIALVGAAWVAVGLLASSLTESRVIAVVAGVVALVALQQAGAAAGLLPPPFSDLLDYLSAANRALAFERGQVALRDVVYFAGLTAGALVLTARVLASRRWR